ncbi:uncharacterized protein BDR25DRAFT_360212 [Lindgomyces ingoldianus]|uniref:Uncharacterized protein n=1 Tax=Lindgomyces ingoldianus TaxID=673940 RepID=A0ACB6QF90_9PLEO|nr:uncharacterized protein BDR25DRAFT_360212 [Lindgomyces ingoldianus]KAF2465689.1 hypothetical protein BDR25DRAFT_360212 [Lindgomyces ingoldianus]
MGLPVDRTMLAWCREVAFNFGVAIHADHALHYPHFVVTTPYDAQTAWDKLPFSELNTGRFGIEICEMLLNLIRVFVPFSATCSRYLLVCDLMKWMKSSCHWHPENRIVDKFVDRGLDVYFLEGVIDSIVQEKRPIRDMTNNEGLTDIFQHRAARVKRMKLVSEEKWVENSDMDDYPSHLSSSAYWCRGRHIVI